ncbi:hypothetical protein [Mangrovimicrobium sediminis]|uniref:hypothetical protein n=1 Tax=Mangrovimicrobium sediminis TaxID=2562682 RepID=UPI0014369484|nr:hypothetical protein [Haliea sp. SAOS-164]
MSVFAFAMALLLPWAAGFAVLRCLVHCVGGGQRAPLSLTVGYGFFLGNALLVAVLYLVGMFTEQLLRWPVHLSLAVIAVIALWLAQRAPRTPPSHHPPQAVASRGQRLLFAALLLLCLLHLGFALVEQLQLPTYPWDAWLAWFYRAKAWFFSGNLAPMVSRAQWLSGVSGADYSIEAFAYPPLVSAIPFWSAYNLGLWSDTLVHLPYFGCGVAVALGLYGQCRERGLSPLLAVSAAYLWLSLPLVDTHLSLAGYADIWMAGFAGLGFVALVRALAGAGRAQLLLGALMLGISAAAKVEGLMWTLLALLLVLACRLPLRWSMALAGVALLAVLTAWLTGYTYVELPLLGGTGYLAGELVLPGMGAHRLELHNPLPAYLRGFLLGGSWHLLWVFLLLAAGLLLGARGGALRRPLLLFLLLFIASQALIFAGTEQAVWASSLTAANRLPLQMSPVLVFACVALFASLRPVPPTGPDAVAWLGLAARLAVWLPPLVAAVVVAAGLWWQAPRAADPADAGREHTVAPAQWRVVVGSGQVQGDRLGINGFDAGAAVLSRSGIHLDSARYAYLRYDVQASIYTNPQLFWRTTRDPGKTYTAALHGTGANVLALHQLKGWKGNIVELGIVLFEDPSRPSSVGGLTLNTASTGSYLRNAAAHWLAFDSWSASSINGVVPAGKSTFPALPAVVALWLLVTLVLYLGVGLASRGGTQPGARSGRLVGAMALSALGAWLVLDLRWSANLLYLDGRAIEARRASAGRDFLPVSNDAQIYALAGQVRQALAGQPPERARVLVLARNREDYPALRAKYHLLPVPAVIGDIDVLTRPRNRGVGYLLQLTSPDRESPGIEALERQMVAARERHAPRLREVLRAEAGVLYELVK